MYVSETWTIKTSHDCNLKLRYVRTVRTVSEQAVAGMKIVQGKGEVHSCTGTEALHR
jgi:hypothetical protein